MCGGKKASNCGPDPASRVWDMACGGETPRVNVALSRKSAEERGRVVERIISCPQMYRTERAGPPSPAPGSHNKAARALSMSGKARLK